MAKSIACMLKKLTHIMLICGAMLYPLAMYVGLQIFSLRRIAIAVNLLISFGYTLFRPPSMVAIFAQRITGMTFNAEQLRYCRQVTLIWVLFFVFNGTAAWLTACCAALEVWSLYNGLIAYGAVGLLFTTELLYRYWRFRRYAGLPTDAFFKKLFPPRKDLQQKDA